LGEEAESYLQRASFFARGYLSKEVPERMYGFIVLMKFPTHVRIVDVQETFKVENDSAVLLEWDAPTKGEWWQQFLWRVYRYLRYDFPVEGGTETGDLVVEAQEESRFPLRHVLPLVTGYPSPTDSGDGEESGKDDRFAVYVNGDDELTEQHLKVKQCEENLSFEKAHLMSLIRRREEKDSSLVVFW
jgi:hypothetical protein